MEVHVVEIIDKYGMEIAIPSVADPKNTSYVVITRGADRFANEIHGHKQQLRSSHELVADLQESGRSATYEERKVNKASRKLRRLQARRKLAQALSALLQGIHKKKHSYQ